MGGILTANSAIRVVDRYLVLTQKDSTKHIFHTTPDLKINFEGEDMVFESDSVDTRIPRKEIADFSHVGRSSLTLDVVAGNHDETPLPDVEVKLISIPSNKEVKEHSDNEGALSFNEIAPGYYTISISGLPLFADYESEEPFLQLENSEMRVIMKEVVRNPEITNFEVIDAGSDLYDLKFSWAIDKEEPEEDYGYTFYIAIDGINFSPAKNTTYELTGVSPGEHVLTIQGISPYGSESELIEHVFNLNAKQAGVENTNADSEGTTELYDINGMTVSPSNSSQGIYIRQGENKSEKFIIR